MSQYFLLNSKIIITAPHWVNKLIESIESSSTAARYSAFDHLKSALQKSPKVGHFFMNNLNKNLENTEPDLD